MLYKVCGNSALLVLNRALLDSIKALLVLNRRYAIEIYLHVYLYILSVFSWFTNTKFMSPCYFIILEFFKQAIPSFMYDKKKHLKCICLPIWLNAGLSKALAMLLIHINVVVNIIFLFPWSEKCLIRCVHWYAVLLCLPSECILIEGEKGRFNKLPFLFLSFFLLIFDCTISLCQLDQLTIAILTAATYSSHSCSEPLPPGKSLRWTSSKWTHLPACKKLQYIMQCLLCKGA